MIREEELLQGPRGPVTPNVSREVAAPRPANTVAPGRADPLGAQPAPAPAEAPAYTVTEVTGAPALAALRREWGALHAQSDAGPFLAWEWLQPWVWRIGAGRSLRVLLAREADGALAGVLPLGLEVRRAAGRRVRRLAFLGETHVGSDYLDVLARRGREEALARAFAAHLAARRSEWDLLDLTDLPDGSVTVRVLQEAFAGPGDVVEVLPRYVCPWEALDPAEPFDAFLKRTGRRDNYLRRRKWLEKQPGFRIERTDAPGALARPMAEFFRLHAARWAGDGGSQGIKGSGVESFHRDATALLAEGGKLRLYTMWVGEKAVASVYGLVHHGTFVYFQSGYDPEWRSKSVGLVLVGETFRDALAEGCRAYDFLRGTETYKSDWVSQQRHTVTVRVYARGGAGAWLVRSEDWARRARNLVKAALPQDAVERVRRLRRKRLAVE